MHHERGDRPDQSQGDDIKAIKEATPHEPREQSGAEALGGEKNHGARLVIAASAVTQARLDQARRDGVSGPISGPGLSLGIRVPGFNGAENNAQKGGADRRVAMVWTARQVNPEGRTRRGEALAEETQGVFCKFAISCGDNRHRSFTVSETQRR
jgi:hypothetical protein